MRGSEVRNCRSRIFRSECSCQPPEGDLNLFTTDDPADSPQPNPMINPRPSSSADEEPPADLLATFPTEPMTVWPISTRVNSPKNDNPGLLVGQETIEAPGLPNLGKWMLDHSGSPAHWLGEIYQGKKLREPINVVIVDTQATSVDDAKERFVEAS